MNSLGNGTLKGLENNRRLKTDKLALSLFSVPLQRKGFTTQSRNSCRQALAIKRKEIKLNLRCHTTSPEVKVWEW